MTIFLRISSLIYCISLVSSDCPATTASDSTGVRSVVFLSTVPGAWTNSYELCSFINLPHARRQCGFDSVWRPVEWQDCNDNSDVRDHFKPECPSTTDYHYVDNRQVNFTQGTVGEIKKSTELCYETGEPLAEKLCLLDGSGWTPTTWLYCASTWHACYGDTVSHVNSEGDSVQAYIPSVTAGITSESKEKCVSTNKPLATRQCQSHNWGPVVWSTCYAGEPLKCPYQMLDDTLFGEHVIFQATLASSQGGSVEKCIIAEDDGTTSAVAVASDSCLPDGRWKGNTTWSVCLPGTKGSMCSVAREERTWQTYTFPPVNIGEWSLTYERCENADDASLAKRQCVSNEEWSPITFLDCPARPCRRSQAAFYFSQDKIHFEDAEPEEWMFSNEKCSTEKPLAKRQCLRNGYWSTEIIWIPCNDEFPFGHPNTGTTYEPDKESTTVKSGRKKESTAGKPRRRSNYGGRNYPRRSFSITATSTTPTTTTVQDVIYVNSSTTTENTTSYLVGKAPSFNVYHLFCFCSVLLFF